MRLLDHHAPAPPTAVALPTLALALAALGALSLGSGDFAFQWQPVPPDVPARAAGAWLAAALLMFAATWSGVRAAR